MSDKRPKIYRLNTFKTMKTGKKYSYLYLCKSRSYRANFNKCSFECVNLRGSILTTCLFKKTKFEGVDFLGTNLRKSNFEGAFFKNCIFVGVLLEGCNFRNANFEDVTFVNTSFVGVKNIDISYGVKVLDQYPKVDVSDELVKVLNLIAGNKNIFTYRVLHLSTKKLII